MVSLVNVQTGKYEPVENPEKAFLSGSHGFRSGVDVYLSDPESGKMYVSKSEGVQGLINAGLRISTADQIKERTLQKEFGDTSLSGVKAFGEGVARGLSFGASDIVLPELFNVSRQAMRERKKRKRGLALTGEITGAVAPIILSGGTGAAFKSAQSLPTAALANIGTRMEKKIASKIVKDGIAKTVVPRAVIGAGEGSIYGLGQLTSEVALGNTDLTADNIISHIGVGAILGGGMTGGLGLARYTGKKALQPIRGVMVKMPSPLKTLKDLETLFEIKSTGAMKPQIQQIKKFNIAGGKKENVVQILKERGVVGKKGFQSFDQTKEVAKVELKKAGQELDDVINRLDKEAKTLGVEADFDPLWRRITDNIINPMRDSEFGFASTIGKSLEKDFAKFAAKWKGKKMPLRTLIEYRRKIRGFARKAGRVPTPDTKTSYIDDIGKMMKELEEELADEISMKTRMGVDYKKAKTTWQVLDWANVALDNKIDSETANLFLSLTDRMAAIGGATAQGLARGSLDPSVLAMGAVAGIFNRTLRTRGASLGAHILNKVNTLGAAAKASNLSQGKIAASVGRFLKAEKPKVVAPLSVISFLNTSFDGKEPKEHKNLQNAFRDRREQLNELLEDPMKTQERILEATAPLSNDAPQVAHSIQRKLAQIIKFAHDTMPKDKRTTPAIFDEEDHMPSDADIAKWARGLMVAFNPQSAMDNLEAGNLSEEGVTALREIYPPLYNYLVAEFIDQAGRGGIKLDYAKKRSLSKILGMVFDETSSPQFIQMIQMNYNDLAMPEAPGPERSPARAKGLDKVKRSEAAKTDVQSALSGPVGGV